MSNRRIQVQAVFALFLSSLLFSNGLSTPTSARVSIITGANGYIGREIVQTLLQQNIKNPASLGPEQIICLVRPNRIEEEQSYWEITSRDDDAAQQPSIRVLPYDMLDGGASLQSALTVACDDPRDNPEVVVYHVASVFGPTEDHRQTALDNVSGAEDVVRTISKFPDARLVLTSSMAAVRGNGQIPSAGTSYTHKDWNTLSELGLNWGQSYQWSKAQSERKARELSDELGVKMTSLCPSFVFGPPSGALTSSYSIELVGKWIRGEAPVQSKLCADVRDVALAHVRASAPQHVGERFIVSSDARIPAQKTAEALKKVSESLGLGDPDSICIDTEVDGGAVKIGDCEAEASLRLRNCLGVICRPVEETMEDMGRILLEMDQMEKEKKMSFWDAWN